MRLGELAWPVRAAFYVALLACSAAADLTFDEPWAPLAVIVAFMLLVLPLLVRSFGRTTESAPHASGRVVVAFAAVLTLLTAIEVSVIPDYGLSAVFWIMAILIPSIEVLGYLTRREARAST